MPNTAVQPLTAGAGGIPWDITAGFTCADRAEGVRGRLPTRGRQLELRAIARQLGLLCEGQGGCLLIDGPSGMGKTRLLAELVQLARRRHLAVASATCDELDRHVPMLPLLTVAKAITRGYHLYALPGGRLRVATDWLDGVLARPPVVQFGLVPEPRLRPLRTSR